MSDLILAGEPFIIEASHASEVTKLKIMQIAKKRFTFFIIGCVVILLIVLQASNNIGASDVTRFNRDLKNYNAKLQIFDRNSKLVASFNIAIAKSDEQKMYGLMNLKKLPKDHGMLFSFKESQVINMWMKNTKIPLDMIFIDTDNEISVIRSDSKPNSLELISSEKEARYVLEINAGLAQELGIEARQKVKILN
jgi:uncharacterized membrane protein (UPF0127 family)